MSLESRLAALVAAIGPDVKALRAGRVQGDAGKAYRVISGVLRNTGSGWGWINDAGHAPSGFGTVTQDATKITIPHSVGGLKVSSLQITPDETYAARGLRCGASVGVSSSNIYLYDGNPYAVGDYVRNANGTTWTSEAGVFTGMSYAASVLTLTHESMGADPTKWAVALTGRGTAGAFAGSLTEFTTQVVYYNGAFGSLTGVGATITDGQSRVWVTRYGIRSVPPANPTSVADAAGNLWVTGLIEVAL